jgi:predicted secreted protein
MGKAYLNDVSFSFNDRQNSTKSIQMTGTGPLMYGNGTPVQEIIPVDNNFMKGQFVRLFLSEHSEDAADNVIAAAKELTLHCSTQLEDATTKDTQGNWQIMQPTGFSFDISSTALMRSSDTIMSQVEAETLADIESIFERSVPVNFDICFVNGDNQRTKYDAICNGQVIITSLVMNGPNRNNADYNTTLNGVGQLYTNEPSIVRTDFPLPISQSDLYELGHGQIVFDRAVSADDLAEKLVIVFGDILGTIETNASGVSISAGIDQMAGLQPNEDETVWSLTGISQNGPVWEGISII